MAFFGLLTLSVCWVFPISFDMLSTAVSSRLQFYNRIFGLNLIPSVDTFWFFFSEMLALSILSGFICPFEFLHQKTLLWTFVEIISFLWVFFKDFLKLLNMSPRCLHTSIYNPLDLMYWKSFSFEIYIFLTFMLNSNVLCVALDAEGYLCRCFLWIQSSLYSIPIPTWTIHLELMEGWLCYCLKPLSNHFHDYILTVVYCFCD